MLIGILEHEHFSEEALSLLDTLGKVVKFETGDINKFLRDLDVLFIRLNYYIGNDFLKKCKNFDKSQNWDLTISQRPREFQKVKNDE